MARNAFSKTQIDRLGDRLRAGAGPHSEADLTLLDDYRRSFGDAHNEVVSIARERGLCPTGRFPKSTSSIVEKLRRESIRLTQIQDIAGCRVVVKDVMEQERVVALLAAVFPKASIVDRRRNPSHGYRAVHVIAQVSGKPVEIQVRTSLQHLWAELSEKCSDVLDPGIKYGGGPDKWRDLLSAGSELVAVHEEMEAKHAEFETTGEALKKATAELLKCPLPDHEVQEMRGQMEDHERTEEESRQELARSRKEIADRLSNAISLLDRRKERME